MLRQDAIDQHASYEVPMVLSDRDRVIVEIALYLSRQQRLRQQSLEGAACDRSILGVGHENVKGDASKQLDDGLCADGRDAMPASGAFEGIQNAHRKNHPAYVSEFIRGRSMTLRKRMSQPRRLHVGMAGADANPLAGIAPAFIDLE